VSSARCADAFQQDVKYESLNSFRKFRFQQSHLQWLFARFDKELIQQMKVCQKRRKVIVKVHRARALRTVVRHSRPALYKSSRRKYWFLDPVKPLWPLSSHQKYCFGRLRWSDQIMSGLPARTPTLQRYLRSKILPEGVAWFASSALVGAPESALQHKL